MDRTQTLTFMTFLFLFKESSETPVWPLGMAMLMVATLWLKVTRPLWMHIGFCSLKSQTLPEDFLDDVLGVLEKGGPKMLAFAEDGASIVPKNTDGNGFVMTCLVAKMSRRFSFRLLVQALQLSETKAAAERPVSWHIICCLVGLCKEVFCACYIESVKRTRKKSFGT